MPAHTHHMLLQFSAQEDGARHPDLLNKKIQYHLFFSIHATLAPNQILHYLEDLFVKEEYRGKGYGNILFQELCEN